MQKPSYPHLAGNLRRLRRACELNQDQLGKRAGFSQQYVSQLERGLTPTSADDVTALARALGCKPAVLTSAGIEIDIRVRAGRESGAAAAV